MKKIILLTIIIFLLKNCCITPAFSQKQSMNDLTLYKEQISKYPYLLDYLIPGFKNQIYLSKSDSTEVKKTHSSIDSTRPKAHDMSKSWWEPLIDLSYWSKLSGPGPFIGLGIDYPALTISKNFSIYSGISFSHSLDNTLQYYITDSIRVPNPPPDTLGFTFVKYDSCISCEKSKAVEILLIKIEAQYHIPRSDFDVYAGAGFSTFFGETFKAFSRGSGSFGASWHALKNIQFGLLCNVFKQFNPESFGAVNESDIKNTIEFVPGAFMKVSLY